ncbi:Uncharacterised protein [Mycobacteroides abscessus subsp. abscessus]|nr:Uncharacterised protein [Mycobacteroides abscessus subsp. abscessus]
MSLVSGRERTYWIEPITSRDSKIPLLPTPPLPMPLCPKLRMS